MKPCLAVALLVCGLLFAPARSQADTGALHDAVARGDAAAIRSAIQAGADVNARDSRGLTPLMVAAERGDTVGAAILLESGADVLAAVGPYSITAVTLARRHGPGSQIAALLEKAAEGKSAAAPPHLQVRGQGIDTRGRSR